MTQVRELNPHLMFGFLAMILVFGQVYPALAQSNQVDHIVINEIDLNPLGDDSKLVIEWIELYNPTDQTIDISGWSISATSGIKTIYKIAEGAKIKSGGFLTYTYGPLWFPDISSTVQIKDKDGTVIDQTPSIKDIDNTHASWQRITDGFDTDSTDDWVFKTANAGSSNGKTSSISTETSLTISVATDKPSYLFGDLVKITGEVSKKVEVANQKYKPEEVNLVILGPSDFERTFVLYPDNAKMFKTDMKTDKAFKLPEGNYVVSAEYAGATFETEFVLSEEAFVPPTKEASAIISISTDKSSYIAGETALISASTTKIIPFVGMQFKVIDPNQKQIYDGTLYPDAKGMFSVKIFINTVKPVFGKYDVIATYDKETTMTSYELVQEIKEDTPISLATDKKAYGLGDTVIITGRSNKVWVSSLDIEIVQAIANMGVKDTMVVRDAVNLEGDSTFRYEFEIPFKTDRYGDYKVTVSKEIGSAQLFFKVVENPDEYVAEDLGPISISTDKSFYDIGDTLVISGKVKETKDLGRQTIKISITTEDGKEIISKADPRASAGKSHDATYTFTGIPDATGNFEITTGVYRNVFEKGTYLIKAVYGKDVASTSFSVEDSLDLGKGVKIIASTDKEVYGIGDQVKLTGKVSTFTAQTSYTIILTDPNGEKTKTGVTINKGEFSWSWTVPTYTKVFGIYKITVDSDSDETNVFFKVSKDPESETASLPLIIETDKAIYNSGETLTVFGTAIKRTEGKEGLVVNARPEIVIKNEKNKELYRAYADLNAGGQFQASFKLVANVFETGDYKVRAQYYDAKAQTIFKVDDKFSTGVNAPLILLVETDNDKYLPGSAVAITGKTNKIVSVFDVDIVVSKEGQTALPVTVRFDPSGSFSYEYKIPETDSLGMYTVSADTDFDTVTDTFEVVSELPAEEAPPETPPETPEIPEAPPETVAPKKITDKVNRITKSLIPITIEEKIVDDTSMTPRIFDGMLRVNPGDEADVNLMIALEDGTCLIGQDDDCEITKPTRTSSSLYKVVEIDGENFKIRYSGPDVRFEKFTILPEDPDGQIPSGQWEVKILKDKQISRFYYKISYMPTE